MQSNDYTTLALMRAREVELNRVAERVRLAYTRRDELRARRAAITEKTAHSGGLADAIATIVVRASQRLRGPMLAGRTGRRGEPNLPGLLECEGARPTR